MSLEKIVGIETEYGIVLQGRQDVSQDTISGWVVEAYAKKLMPEASEAGQHRIRRFDHMLPNGARLYVDHGHPEYSTPECRSLQDLLACDKAGEKILLQAVQAVNEKLADGQRIQIFKNNTDHRGRSYGCHENYLMAAETFKALLEKNSPILFDHLIPFLVTRQIYAGAGKVGSENGRPSVEYQISQRADFFETIIGLQTTDQRPIFNTRDEPHADPKRFRRLHVILGDANMCEVATFLKVGTMQLILQMLEDDVELPDMRLKDPVRALHIISHDPIFEKTIKRKNGQSISPIEIQKEFWNAADRYVQENPELQGGQQILEKWRSVLEKLPNEQEQLIGQLDWITKRSLIQRFMHQEGESWESPFVSEMDIKYHNINPQESLFYLLQEAEGIKRLIPENSKESFIDSPPQNTRARLRGEYLQKFSDKITDMDWSQIKSGERKISLPDPQEFEIEEAEWQG